MIKGIFKSVAFYATGLLLTWLSYASTENHYAHGPGLHHLIIFATFAAGFFWLLFEIVLYLVKERKASRLGVIITNLTLTIGFVAFIIYALTPLESLTTLDDSVPVEASGDTNIMRQDGNIVYMKIKDSVRINYIDSSMVDWDKVEYRSK